MSGRMGMILTSGYQVAWPTSEPVKTQNVAETVVQNYTNTSSNYRKGAISMDLYDLMKSKSCAGCK